MSLSEHVRTLGRGPGRSRSLTEDEAFDAMSLMLQGAEPQAVGACLMLMRMKGETAEEIAGFARAAQEALPPLPHTDLDWPSYAAGRTRGLPWFLLSAKLLAASGRRVMLHGWNGADGAVRDGLETLGIAVARTPQEAAVALDEDRIVYLPLEDLHPALFALLDLRRVFGLRSCVNTVCRMLNPARAGASVQGVFHPSYRLLQADAAELAEGWPQPEPLRRPESKVPSLLCMIFYLKDSKIGHRQQVPGQFLRAMQPRLAWTLVNTKRM